MVTNLTNKVHNIFINIQKITTKQAKKKVIHHLIYRNHKIFK